MVSLKKQNQLHANIILIDELRSFKRAMFVYLNQFTE